MEKHKKFGGPFTPSDKVQELKDVLGGNTAPTEQNPQNEDIEPQEVLDLRAQVEDLTAKLAKSSEEALTNKNELLRAIADFDNTRKRLKKESEELARYANEKLLSELLPIIDSLEMSLTHSSSTQNQDSVIEGVQLTLKQFLTTLEKFGLSPIEGLGEVFDPNTQEAIGSIPAENINEGCVAQVHRKGYKLNNRVIRPAMVSIKS